MAKKVLTHQLSAPLNDAATARVDIDLIDGNLTIGSLTQGDPALITGTLEYLEYQGVPVVSERTSRSQTEIALKSSRKGQPWLRMPWSACNGATDWQIRLNPDVAAEIKAHTGGGNVNLHLNGLALTRLTVDTGGGNLDITLPDSEARLNVDAKSGAGNVTVHLPEGTAARVHATSGLGKVLMAPNFHSVGKDTYQTDGYEHAAHRVEMVLASGAGNVSVDAKIAQAAREVVRV